MSNLVKQFGTGIDEVEMSFLPSRASFTPEGHQTTKVSSKAIRIRHVFSYRYKLSWPNKSYF